MEQNVYLFVHQKCRSSGALNELKAQTIDPKQMPLLFFHRGRFNMIESGLVLQG